MNEFFDDYEDRPGIEDRCLICDLPLDGEDGICPLGHEEAARGSVMWGYYFGDNQPENDDEDEIEDEF